MRMKPALVLAFGLTLSGVSQAKSQNAAQVFTQKGTETFAFFSFGPSVICADGSTGTASGFGSIIASDSIFHSPGSPKSVSNGGFIEVFGYSDSCTGASIGFGQGQLSYTAPNSPQLTSSSVTASGFIQDFDTGNSYPLSINLVFTGNGPLEASKGTFVYHDTFGDTVTVQRSANASRQAGVTGTIAINGVEPEVVYSTAILIGNSNGSTVVQAK